MAGLLNIGVSALLSYQRVLNTAGHNIANANTPGYSRQRVDLATQTPQNLGVGWIGSGVKVTQIERQYNDFLALQVRSSLSTTAQLETYRSQASRFDGLLADSNIGLDPAIQDFFNALQGVADDPASTSARQVMLLETRSLVDRFHDLNGQYDDARNQLNNEMDGIVREVNGLADALARINGTIAEAFGSAGGGTPNDLLDKRDQLLGELSQRVGITTVEQDDGALNIFIGNGQSLVTGTTAASLSTVVGTDASERDIAYTSTAGTQVITSQLSGGKLGGLLSFSDEILDSGQNQLGLIALGIGDRLNAQQQLGLDLDGNLGGQIFGTPQTTSGVVLNNGTGTVSFAYSSISDLTASDYELRYDGGTNYTLTRLTDGQSFSLDTTVPASLTNDGFTLTLGGAPAVGERTSIRPTRMAAGDISLMLTDGRQFAAAGPLRAQATTNAVTSQANGGSGAISQPVVSSTNNLPLAGPSAITLEWDPNAGGAGVPGFLVTGGPGGTLLYNPATESAGKSFSLSGYGDPTFSVSGVPVDGDRFVIENNSGAVGDNRNALLMAQIQSQDNLLGDSANGIAPSATFQEFYGQMVSDVGTRTHLVDNNLKSQEAMLERNQSALASVAGVNLDEEAANLIRYQQAYQAAAQVISVSSDLFDVLLGAFRR